MQTQLTEVYREAMLHPFAFIPILAVLAVIPQAVPATATVECGGPTSSGPLTVAAANNQVRLVLQLRGDAYPHNAPVPVTLRLTNLSLRPIYTWDCLSASLNDASTSPRTVAADT